MPRRIAKDLSRRTEGEELFVARKARGETQREAAARLRVGRTAYAEAERDEKPLRRRPTPLESPDLGVLSVLARRRSGLGRERVLELLGISAPTLNAREASGDARLIEFWRSKGFRFPA